VSKIEGHLSLNSSMTFPVWFNAFQANKTLSCCTDVPDW